MFWKIVTSYFVNNPRSKITSVDLKDNILLMIKTSLRLLTWEYKKLNISITSVILEDILMIQDPIRAAIEECKRRSSVLKINK